MKRRATTSMPRSPGSARPRCPRRTTSSWKRLRSRLAPTVLSQPGPCSARTREPDMANVQMPRLSDSMETGKILRWLKKEGEEVKKGEPLVEIESDKANIEVEAYASGKLSRILVQEGPSAPIGAVIAEIGGAAAQQPVATPEQAAAASPAAKEAAAPRPQATN